MELYFNKSIGKYRAGQTRQVPDPIANLYLRRKIASKATYQTKVMVPDVSANQPLPPAIQENNSVDFESIDDAEVLRGIAKERGIDVHHRAGAEKIKEALKGA